MPAVNSYDSRVSDPSPGPAVLHVVHNFTGIGGVQEHVRDLLSGIGSDLEQYVLSPENGFVTLFDSTGAAVRRYPGAELEWPVAPLQSQPHDEALLTVLAELRPSAIHLHHLSGWPLGMLALIRASGVKWICTFHDYVAITPHGGMIGALDPEWTFTADYSVAVYGRDISEFCIARRDFIGEALAGAAVRIAPSPYVARVAGKIYPGAYAVVEHGVRGIVASERAQREDSGLRFGY